MSYPSVRYQDSKPYAIKDGALIRELMHPSAHGNSLQSLAEATVEPGQESAWHRHRKSEKLYHITAGKGWMALGEENFVVRAGDTICIPAGMPHSIHNTGVELLRMLYFCSPAYSHDDTELLPVNADRAPPAGSSQN